MSFLNKATWDISSFPLTLSVWFRFFRYSFIDILAPSKHVSLSLRLSSSPRSIQYILFLYSCFSCLHLKCRNPSTAFYQAFQPSRLQGSKPFNNRYGLGCVDVCMCGLDWLAKPDCAPLITQRTLQKMSILTCHLAIYGFLKCHFSCQ